MRIYAVADLHGRPGRLRTVAAAVARLRPDVLVAAGDLANYRRPRQAVRALGRLDVPALAVRGNTDPPRMERFFDRASGIAGLHLRRSRLAGVAFAGVGGTLPLPFVSMVAWREASLLARLAPLVDRDTVLVAHPPPRGVLDRVMGRFPAGSRGLRRLILQRRPALAICGHVHESAGTARLGETLVVNCTLGAGGGGMVVDWQPGGRPRAVAVDAHTGRILDH